MIYCSVVSMLINTYMCVHVGRLSNKRKGENRLFMLLLHSGIVLTLVKKSSAFCSYFYFCGLYRIFHVDNFNIFENRHRSIILSY